jgi:hypothetical protein
MSERRSFRILAACMSLTAAGLLGACGVGDENGSAPPAATAAVPATAQATTPSTFADGSVASTDGSSCNGVLERKADPEGTAALQAAAGPGGGATAAEQITLPRPFSSSSPWNTPVDGQSIDARSRTWIARASRRVTIGGDAQQQGVNTTQRRVRDLRLFVNTCAWTPAIVSTQGGETVRIVCRQRDCGPVAKTVKTLRVPAGIEPFPEFDGWYSIIDEAAHVGYDMWRARRVGDVVSYQFIKRWPLDGPGFSPPANNDPVAAVSARGSGLPLFAGVIQPDELRRGRIEHALAISVPGPAQRVFVQPASVTNGLNVTGSLPEGARLRLRSDRTPAKPEHVVNRRAADAIITALHTYGAIVVDRSITPTLYARRGDYGSLLAGNELQGISLSDFDVVQAGPLLRFPPLDATREEGPG